MSSKERVARDARIVSLRAQGFTWDSIGEEVGLSARQCRVVWAQWRDQEKLEIQQLDPLDIVFDMLARLDAQIEQLGHLGLEARATRNYNAAVGAVRAQGAAQEQMMNLMLETGVMPRHLGKIQVELEIRYVVTKILSIFDEYGMPPEARVKLLDVFRRAETGGARAALSAGDN
jgi:hypothetical protein